MNDTEVETPDTTAMTGVVSTRDVRYMPHKVRVFTAGSETWLLKGEGDRGRWLRVGETETRLRWHDLARALTLRDDDRDVWIALMDRIGMEVY